MTDTNDALDNVSRRFDAIQEVLAELREKRKAAVEDAESDEVAYTPTTRDAAQARVRNIEAEMMDAYKNADVLIEAMKALASKGAADRHHEESTKGGRRMFIVAVLAVCMSGVSTAAAWYAVLTR